MHYCSHGKIYIERNIQCADLYKNLLHKVIRVYYIILTAINHKIHVLTLSYIGRASES